MIMSKLYFYATNIYLLPSYKNYESFPVKLVDFILFLVFVMAVQKKIVMIYYKI